MEEKTKYQGRGGYRGGGRPKGINQEKMTFKISKENKAYLFESVGNKNALVNMLIEEYRKKVANMIEVVDSLLSENE